MKPTDTAGAEEFRPPRPVRAGPAAVAAIRAVARRPDLWLTALRVGRSAVARGWWRRRPWLPLPDPAWLRFRLVTAYGGEGDVTPSADDVLTWLEWCRRFPSARPGTMAGRA